MNLADNAPLKAAVDAYAKALESVTSTTPMSEANKNYIAPFIEAAIRAWMEASALEEESK